MSVSDYEQWLRACSKENQHVIETPSELITETEHHRTVCNSVKTGGTAAGLVGTGLLIGSLVAAPFSGGASLLLTASAAVCSVGGAATNIVTGAVDRSQTKKIIGEIQSLINSRTEITSKLKEQSVRFSRVIEHLVLSDLNEHTAFYTTFTALANGRLNLSTSAGNVSDYENFIVMGRLIQTEFELLKSLGATSKAVAIASKTLLGINQMILKGAPMLAEEATRLGTIGSSAMTAGGQALKTGGQAASGLYWLTRNGGSWATYEKSKLVVYRMFLNLDDQIRIWVSELKRFGY
ncbi:unnamed protein product [Didymodactylos carnosus]|uniref:Uncharacterized protein n=1 Tax=Didymodactylos carnosus TaxID=1234261 RepID=A0A815GT91_9BILA|nr:unnamed protein product [Didymodactylos carnosus]CAF4208816.1 unnamed protein product [Didymodactylos carnosus]